MDAGETSGRGNLTGLLRDNSDSMYTLWPRNSQPTRPPSPGARGDTECLDSCIQAELGKATDEDGDNSVEHKPTAEEVPVSSAEGIGPRQPDQMPKELFGSSFKRTRSLRYSRLADEPPQGTPSTALHDGSVFKAVHVECNRTNAKIQVRAVEILMVDPMDNPSVDLDRPEGDFRAGSNTFKRRTKRCPSVEKRKVIPAKSFAIDAPGAYLQLHETETGVTIISLAHGSLPEGRFPAMGFEEGLGYSETNAATVLFGLDMCAGNHWMTPVALVHVKSMWHTIRKAGGVFVVDFDVSWGGWARFQTAYVCPAPSKTVQYVHVCKPKARSSFGGDVDRPLAEQGGKMLTSGFAPSRTSLDDPKIFHDISQSLLLLPTSEELNLSEDI